jgi:hypothetical protein
VPDKARRRREVVRGGRLNVRRALEHLLFDAIKAKALA